MNGRVAVTADMKLVHRKMRVADISILNSVDTFDQKAAIINLTNRCTAWPARHVPRATCGRTKLISSSLNRRHRIVFCSSSSSPPRVRSEDCGDKARKLNTTQSVHYHYHYYAIHFYTTMGSTMSVTLGLSKHLHLIPSRHKSLTLQIILNTYRPAALLRNTH